MPDLLPVIAWPSPALRTFARPAASFDQRHQALAASLSAILRVTQSKGIAAPQVGFDMRVIVVEVPGLRVKGKPQYAAFVNPRIVEESPIEAVACEDCLSLHSISHLFVPRPTWVAVESYNLQGEPRTHRYEGGVAALFCHLIDHLDGRCLPERLSEIEHQRLRALRAPYAGDRVMFEPPPPVVITDEQLTPEQEAAEEQQLANDIADAALPHL